MLCLWNGFLRHQSIFLSIIGKSDQNRENCFRRISFHFILTNTFTQLARMWNSLCCDSLIYVIETFSINFFSNFSFVLFHLFHLRIYQFLATNITSLNISLMAFTWYRMSSEPFRRLEAASAELVGTFSCLRASSKERTRKSWYRRTRATCTATDSATCLKVNHAKIC